ncbi:MAG: hydroxyisourate hydrolase [Candidatus Velthaea sp.]
MDRSGSAHAMSATISTHVLDTARGVAAPGIAIALYAIDGERRELLARAVTNADGRTDAPLAQLDRAGTYELVFAAGAYFAALETATFFDEIAVRFAIGSASGSYHIPLLLAPWSYTTYRGS